MGHPAGTGGTGGCVIHPSAGSSPVGWGQLTWGCGVCGTQLAGRRGAGVVHRGAAWGRRGAGSCPLGVSGCGGTPNHHRPLPNSARPPPPDTGGAPSAGGRERCGAAPRTAAGTPRAAQPIPTAPRKKRPPTTPCEARGVHPPLTHRWGRSGSERGGGTPKRGARPEIGGNEGRLQG